jgi:hypothetical protein
MPCPHSRYHWSICPNCNGVNESAQQQLEIEAPRFEYEIVEKEEPKPAGSSVIVIDIAGGDDD